jgi:hypothetical protein
MNPPFRLMPEVVRHIQRHGGHVLVLSPEWAEGFHALRGMARAAHRLPKGPMFRREGWDLLPPPSWDVLVFYIWHRPHHVDFVLPGQAEALLVPLWVDGGQPWLLCRLAFGMAQIRVEGPHF